MELKKVKLRIHISDPDVTDQQDSHNLSLAEFTGTEEMVLRRMKYIMDNAHRAWLPKSGDAKIMKVRYHVSVVAPETPSPCIGGEVLTLKEFEGSPDSTFFRISEDAKAAIAAYNAANP